MSFPNISAGWFQSVLPSTMPALVVVAVTLGPGLALLVVTLGLALELAQVRLL